MSRVDVVADVIELAHEADESFPNPDAPGEAFKRLTALAIVGALAEHERGDFQERSARAFEKLHRGKPPYTFDATMTPETEALVDRVISAKRLPAATDPTGPDVSTPASPGPVVQTVAGVAAPVTLNDEDTSATATARATDSVPSDEEPKPVPTLRTPVEPTPEPRPIDRTSLVTTIDPEPARLKSEPELLCSHCERTFFSPHGLNVHVARMHRESYVPVSSASSPPPAAADAEHGRRYFCEHDPCFFSTSSPSEMAGHEATAHAQASEPEPVAEVEPGGPQPQRGDFDVVPDRDGWRAYRHDTAALSTVLYPSASAAYDAFDAGRVEWAPVAEVAS